MRQYLYPFQQRELLAQLIKRDVNQRFKGSWLGLGWAIVTPLAMLAVYTFVFRTILKARWPGGVESNSEFALQLFSGLLVYTLFSEIIGRAPKLIIEQPNLVKKVIFPLEILPWVSIFSSYFFAAISLSVLLLGVVVLRDGIAGLNVVWLSLPLIFVVFLPLLLGLSWLLAALGVYLQDTSHVVGLILTPMLFLSPVFYPLESMSESVQLMMQLNPLTMIIGGVRDIVMQGHWPNFRGLAMYFVVSVGIAIMGAWCFEKTRRGFADVL